MGKFIDMEAVKIILSGGFDIDAKNKDTGFAPLHLAASEGDMEIVELLLASGADINVTDVSGCTPLYFAVSFGHERIIELLVSKGVDVNIKNGDGSTSFDVARTVEAKEFLIKHGARSGKDLK